ncbi:SMI1/KNR4 family protein [Sunxiuqinia elliptica]|uniref:SMI1 / KNR4 family (SUKH-1) n=1 Tax=Sunxiuqinia elliptica TaxID=655355 RepID=A0A1I2KXM5_9BACT|nr:SMI1/KNR4 family protein [Sunxiuqinia elliptica]SFF69791.1 SMI1 / KNR4 family (SUKH-1) [Sunxiuqinia elliptica]
MNIEVWNTWISKIEWILKIAKKRNWDYTELTIKKPVSEKAFEILEKELNIEYPSDFKEVLTKYSSAVLMDWQIEGEEPEGEFQEIFCGAGRGYLWDFDSLRDDYKNIQGWINECFSNPEDEYDKVWYNKIPFLDVPNGDVIAFGEKTDKGNQVVYLSHEGDDFHGQILGESFIDFIDKWTRLGCVGTEDWQFEPFYNYETKTLLSDKSILDKWVKWLEK